MANVDLTKYGITGTTEIVHNPSYETLFEEETKAGLEGYEVGKETELGAVNVKTGIYTGRSPKDKYIVMDENSKDTVWWNTPEYPNDNHPMKEDVWATVKDLAKKELCNKKLFVVDAFCGANKDTRMAVRFIVEVAWQAHFVTNMFIKPSAEELENFEPDFVVYNASKAKVENYKELGLNSETCVAFNITSKEQVIINTWYGGEMKKGMFSMMNYFLPLKGIASMHCSANADMNGENTAIFFGLSGTGKTTLSTDPKRLLIGDDEHGWDERTGEITYSYFVPDGQRRSKTDKKLIVIGTDLTGYTLQGYRDGGCDPGEEIDGVSCTVTRSATTLHEVLLTLCWEILDTMEENPGYYGWLSEAAEILNPETYCLLAERALEQYGLLSDKPVDRYDSGRLDELMDEVLSVDRVLYLKTEVTVPTGGTAEVTAQYWKAPSFDFACSGSGRRNLQGYDLMTTLDSTLTFTAQTASVTHAENVQITGQNFGFDPENGVTEVKLDPNQPHYYLKIQPVPKETD